MKVVYMSKPDAIEPLKYLRFVGVDVIKVIDTNIQYTTRDISNADLVISYLYPRIIPKEAITHPKLGCINFHPAPLPEYRGFAPYSFGIFNRATEWGVTAHYISEKIDSGDIISKMSFGIKPETETAYSLKKKSHQYLITLFKHIIDELLRDEKLVGIPQPDGGHYYSKSDFEKLRIINKSDSPEVIERKVRACWCPPFEGVYIKVKEL